MSTNNHNSSNDNVDERVVSMRFDNAEFERRTKTTMKTLDKLKAKLNFKGATDSLQKFSRESSKFNLDGVSGAVQACQNKISAWEVAGITAIANITNSAVNAGKKITKALTIEPVFTGFNEYETKINSIQTIMSNTASKGTTMEEVVRVIDELNTYADLTIYNFSEMTRNIGTFTAAGIGLQDAADSIQGIANLAAASGSNSQQASTAMYQLSQALAAGTVKLQDWNSVVNAGMGGELFQNALKQTAREMGIAVDEIIESQGSFRESLSQGWMTADVLSTTLRKFTKKGAKEYSDAMMASGQYTQEMADSLAAEAQNMEDAATKVKTFTQLWDTLKETAQSGWGKTWELIIGNFDEAKELFTNLNNRFSPILDKMSDARNAVIEGAMGSPSKWEEMIKLVNKAGFATSDFEKTMESVLEKRGMSLEKLVEQYGSLENAFANGPLWSNLAREAIRKMTTEEMKFGGGTMNAAEKLEYFQKVVDEVWAGDWDNNPERMRKLTEAGYEYEAVQDLVNATMNERKLTLEDLTVKQMRAIGYTEEEIKEFQLLKESAHDSNAELYQFIETLNKKSGRELLVQSIYNILDAIGNVLKSVGQGFRDVFSPVQAEDVYSIIEAFEKFTRKLIINEDQMDKLRRTFRGLFSIINAVKMIISTGLRLALKVVGALLGNVNIDFLTLTATIGDGLTVIGEWIKKHDLVGKVMEKIGPILEKAGTKLGEWIDSLKGSKNIAKDIGQGILTGLGFVAGAIGGIFKQLASIIGNNIGELLGKLNFNSAKESIETVYHDTRKALLGGVEESAPTKVVKNYVKTVSEAISASVKDNLPVILDSLKNIFTTAKDWFVKNFDPGVVIGLTLIFSLYKTLNTISEIVDKFAAPAEALAGMFDSIGGTFDAMTKQIKAMKFASTATSVLMLAGAVAILAGSIYLISKIPKEDLGRSVGAIIGMTVMVTAMLVVVSKATLLSKQSESVNMMALLGFIGGLAMMAYVMKELSGIPQDDIDKSLNAIGILLAGILSSLVILILVTKTSKDLNMGAVGLMAAGLGVAMLLLAAAVKIAGSIKPVVLKNGLKFVAACGVIMTLLVAVIHGNASAILASGFILVAMTFAMQNLVATVFIAGTVSDSMIKQSLKVMFAMLSVMTVMILISKLGGIMHMFVSGGSSIISMTLAMALMVGVVHYINTVEMGDINYANLILTAIAGVFAKFMVTSFVAGQNAAKAGAMLMQAAIAIGILVGVIWLINKLNMADDALKKANIVIFALSYCMKMMIKATKDSEDAKANIIAASIAIGVLTGAVYALYFIAKDAKQFAIAIAGFAVIVGGLFAVLKAVKDLDDSNIGATIALIAGMVLLFGMIAGIIVVLTAISKIFKADVKGVAFSIAAVFTSMSFMMYAIGKNADEWKKMDKNDVIRISQIIIALSGMMLVIASMLWIISKMNFSNSWTQIGQITAVLTLLTGLAIVIIRFGNTTSGLKDFDNVFWIILALGGIMLAIAGILTLVNKYGTSTDWNVLVQMMILTTFLTALAIVIVRFGQTPVQNVTGALALIGELTVVMFLLSGVMLILNFVDANGAIKKVAAMSILIGALTGVTILLTRFAKGGTDQDLLRAMMSMAILSGLCVIVGFVMHILDDLNPEGIIPKAIALGVLMDALAAAVVILSAVGAAASAAWQAVPIFAAVLIIVAGVIIGAMVLFNKFVASDLPKVGLQLAMFGNAIKPFIESMKQIDATAVAGCIHLAELFGALTGAVVLDEIINLFGGKGWTDIIGEKLNKFGEAVVEFSNILNNGNINIDAVEAATNIGMMLSELEKSMHQNPEWLTKWIGQNDMGAFGTRLAEFAEGMFEFNMRLIRIGKLDKDQIQNFCDAIKPLVKLAKDIPNTGGLLGDMLGNNDIDEWGAKLPKFAMYMSMFDAALKFGEYDKSVYQNFAECVTPLLELSQTIPNSGGLLGDLVGNNDIDVWGAKLPGLGKGMAGFVDAISGRYFVKSTFENVRDCMDVIIQIANKIPSDGEGWIQKLMGMGKQDLGVFGTNLGLFGQGLGQYGSAIDGVDAFKSGEALTVTEDVSKLADILPTESDIKKISKKIQSMIDNSMSSKLYDLGTMLVTWTNSTKDIDLDRANNAAISLQSIVSALDNSTKLNFKSIDNFGGALTSLGSDTIKGFIDAFEGSYVTINEAITSFIINMDNIFRVNEYLWTIRGQHIPDNIKDGITNHEDKAYTKLTEFVNELKVKADQSTVTFEKIGENYVMGMVGGMNNVRDKLIEASTELGNIAAQATAGSLDEHSPSKVMEHIGEYAGMGFIVGLRNLFGLTDKTSTELGDGVSTNLSDILKETLDAFNSSDFHPVITPVLDLSMVRTGMADISSILNGNMPNIGYYGGNYSATNDDVISAINELNDTLTNLEINNYTVGNISYDDGSSVGNAVKQLVTAANIKRRM